MNQQPNSKNDGERDEGAQFPKKPAGVSEIGDVRVRKSLTMIHVSARRGKG